MILLKNDEVIDFLTLLPTDFSALKDVQAMFEVSTTSSKFQHKPSVTYFDKSFTALSIGPCGRLPQIT